MKPIESRFKKEGFTLVELLISIAIIGSITGIVIYNQGKYSDNLALTNTTTNIELILREAQSYSIAVREFAATTDEFNVAYGTSFNIGNSGSSNTSFLSFVDRGTLNGYYDTPTTCLPGSSSECLLRNNLTGKNIISDLCVLQANNQKTCKPSVARLDISFLRPNPNAIITFFNAGGNTVSFSNSEGARIEVTSPSGAVQNINIYNNGQISIQ